MAQRADEVVEMASELLARSQETIYHGAAEDTSTLCHFCGDVDAHAKECPAVALAWWLAQDE